MNIININIRSLSLDINTLDKTIRFNEGFFIW